MSAFDPSRHYIIARDKETGEHAHVSLPDLVREVRTIEVASPVASFDDTQIRAALMALEDRAGRAEQQARELAMRLDQLNAMTKQHEADLQQIMHALTNHTHETIRSAAA